MGDLEERLRSHSTAFDGLLSLIPAKNYYAPKEGNSQWNKRKQSKAESVRAKKAKLDPDALVSAAEVRDNGGVETGGEEEEEGEDEEMGDAGVEDEEGSEAEGGEGMVVELGGGEEVGRDEREEDYEDVSDEEEGEGERVREKVEAGKEGGKKGKKEKKEKKKEKKKKQNTPAKKDKKASTEILSKSPTKLSKSEKKKLKRAAQLEAPVSAKTRKEAQADKLDNGEAMDIDSGISLPGLTDDSTQASGESTASTSPALSNTTIATTPPSEPQSQEKPDSIIDMRARLAARIAVLRAARKAIGTNPLSDGDEAHAPPRSRQELMEARAKKEALRKAKKAEARKAAQLDAKEKAKAAMAVPNTNGIVASSSRGTSVDGFASPAPIVGGSSYSFGKVLFDDGGALEAGLGGVSISRPGAGKKRKGPGGGDAKALLEQVKRKKARLEEMDEEKRGRVEESERWGKALSRVNGEKVRDDEKLLKKTVKRVEEKKRKSEREWNDRKESVEKAKAMKQKKREENLAKRKEQKKAGKGGKKVLKKGGKMSMNRGGNKKRGSRPGFEGGFGARAKAGGGGKGKK
ncbi:surfeit locus protein 6-domain-containing protein [Tirmania nivea]|nr:surfeit locus protein 6-domain-containing protein [Tirmania nivea]